MCAMLHRYCRRGPWKHIATSVCALYQVRQFQRQELALAGLLGPTQADDDENHKGAGCCATSVHTDGVTSYISLMPKTRLLFQVVKIQFQLIEPKIQSPFAVTSSKVCFVCAQTLSPVSSLRTFAQLTFLFSSPL